MAHGVAVQQEHGMKGRPEQDHLAAPRLGGDLREALAGIQEVQDTRPAWRARALRSVGENGHVVVSNERTVAVISTFQSTVVPAVTCFAEVCRGSRIPNRI